MIWSFHFSQHHQVTFNQLWHHKSLQINITDTPETSMHFQNTPTALGRLLTSDNLEEH